MPRRDVRPIWGRLAFSTVHRCCAPTKSRAAGGGRSRHQRDVYRLFSRLLAGEEADGALGFSEGEGVGVEALEGVLAGLDETDRALVVRVVDAEGADDRELFEDDLVA